MKMSDIEFFHNKNPQARLEYCDFATKLYQILLRQDAFENNVQIEKYYNSFNFIFPNGEITIMTFAPMNYPCYVTHINGNTFNDFFVYFCDITSWLKENWDDLVKST